MCATQVGSLNSSTGGASASWLRGIQAKWLSAVTLTSNLPAFGAVRETAMPNAFLDYCRAIAMRMASSGVTR